MREIWSRRLAYLTGLLILSLCYVVAKEQNSAEFSPPPRESIAAPAPSVSSSAEAGHEIFVRERCARCHSIAGKGSQRNPLDDVGARLTGEEIRKYILAPPETEQELPRSAYLAKQQYARLPDKDIDDLVAFLGNLQTAARE